MIDIQAPERSRSGRGNSDETEAQSNLVLIETSVRRAVFLALTSKYSKFADM